MNDCYNERHLSLCEDVSRVYIQWTLYSETSHTDQIYRSTTSLHRPGFHITETKSTVSFLCCGRFSKSTTSLNGPCEFSTASGRLKEVLLYNGRLNEPNDLRRYRSAIKPETTFTLVPELNSVRSRRGEWGEGGGAGSMSYLWWSNSSVYKLCLRELSSALLQVDGSFWYSPLTWFLVKPPE